QVIAFNEGHIYADKTAEILGVAGREHLLRLGQALVRRDVDTALSVLDFIDGYGHDLVHFSVELLHHLRDMTMVRAVTDGREITDLSDGEYQVVVDHVEDADISQLQRMFQIMAEAVEQISKSQFPKLLLEMTLVKLAAIEPLVPLEPLIARLESLERSLGGDIDEETWSRYRELVGELMPPPREVRVVVERTGDSGAASPEKQPPRTTPPIAAAAIQHAAAATPEPAPTAPTPEPKTATPEPKAEPN